MLTEKDIAESNKAELRLVTERLLCEKSFYYFFVRCTTEVYKNVKWIYPPFYKYVCDRLQWYFENYLAGNDSIGDLIITCPYRSGKSTILESYRSWCWARRLNIDFLSVCATSVNALKSNRKIKNIIESPWYQRLWAVKFAKDQHAKGAYNNQINGSMVALGVNSSAVGKDASILVVDDPNEVQSKTASDIQIQNVLDRFRDSLYSRLNEPSKGYRVICQQRVADYDLTGWLLKNVKKIEHICLPIEWNEKVSTLTLRYLYDAEGYLWHDRYTTEYLAELEKVMSANAIASQLYAGPTAISGTAILRSWFNTIEDQKIKQLGQSKTYMFVDGAFTSDKSRDPSAFYICKLINKRIYVIYAEEDWLEWHDAIEHIKSLVSEYNIKELYIENKGPGLSFKQEIHHQIPTGLFVTGVDPQRRSKADRVKLCQPYFRNGNVILKKDNTWNEKFLDRCAAFTGVKRGGKDHDDIVDCLSYSVIVLLIKRYSVKSIKEAGENLPDTDVAETRIIDKEKYAFQNEHEDQNYYS